MDSSSLELFKIDLIKQINKYRNEHGAKSLTNDSKIDKIAQKFVEQLAKKGKLDYSYNQYKGEDLGESVYQSELYLAPLKLAKIFYDENKEYNYKDKDPEPSNFTQMVWKNTELIGFGMQKGLKGKYYYVINYYPTGNVDGQFNKNVFPPGTSASDKYSNKKYENNEKEFIKKDKDNYVRKVYKKREIFTNDEPKSKKTNNSNNNTNFNFNIKEKFDHFFDDDDDFFNFGKDNFEFKFVNNKKNEKIKEKEKPNKTNIKNMDDKFSKLSILEQLINKKKEDTNKNKIKHKVQYEIEEEVEEEDEEEEDDEDYKDNNKYNKYENNKNNNKYEPSPSSYGSNSDFNQFCLEALDSHNKYRKIHHVEPLKLNKDLCKIAQNYAKQLTNMGYLEHSENCYKGETLGENLFYCYGQDPSGAAVSKNWYGENKNHNYSGDWKSNTGHFTQMIWKETKEVGFGKCKNKRGEIYVVGNYYPAGNIIGFFKYNVFRP